MSEVLSGNLKECPLCGGPIMIVIRKDREYVACSNPECMRVREFFATHEENHKPGKYGRVATLIPMWISGVLLGLAVVSHPELSGADLAYSVSLLTAALAAAMVALWRK